MGWDVEETASGVFCLQTFFMLIFLITVSLLCDCHKEKVSQGDPAC